MLCFSQSLATAVAFGEGLSLLLSACRALLAHTSPLTSELSKLVQLPGAA